MTMQALMTKISNIAYKAAKCRLNGHVQQAQHWDKRLDDAMRHAEGQGWADEALEAEEKGREAA